MQAKRIRTAEDRDFRKSLELYEKSFPYEEKRDGTVLAENLQDDRFHFYVFRQEEGSEDPVAFFTYWKLDSCIYGEHFAVDSRKRNGGIGHSVLEFIKREIDAPMILEIEDPVDELTCRRKGFYERNGFILNPHRHFQPPYHPDCAPLEMKVMTWPKTFTAAEYDSFRDEQLTIAPRQNR